MIWLPIIVLFALGHPWWALITVAAACFDPY